MEEKKYFFTLYSPYTYTMFLNSKMDRCGLPIRYAHLCEEVNVGDILIVYMKGISRFVGIFEVMSKAFNSEESIYFEGDPFKIQFFIKPVVLLQNEFMIPIFNNNIWNNLSSTKGKTRSAGWAMSFFRSIGRLKKDDGILLEKELIEQYKIKKEYPLSKHEISVIEYSIKKGPKKWEHKEESFEVKTDSKEEPIIVTVPSGEEVVENEKEPEIKESLKIQSMVSKIGETMGYKVWIPSHDRTAIKKLACLKDETILSILPLNYDDVTLKTIEQIDVIWINKRTIVRTFEIEHTTSIYSGILRMADLLSLQPNMNIKIHIVAPETRREKVFQEIQRPVFSLLEKGPLSQYCSFITYESIDTILNLKHLDSMSDEVLENYCEYAYDE